MHLFGKVKGYSYNSITFAVDGVDTEAVKNLKDKDLAIDVDPIREKRSLNANAYFWKLCDQIAKVIGSDKDTVYKLQLEKYGEYYDVSVRKDGLSHLCQMWRHYTILDDYEMECRSADGDEEIIPMVTVRCFEGSSHYNTAEMSRLIDGTVSDAKDLGIETWSDEELGILYEKWRPTK